MSERGQGGTALAWPAAQAIAVFLCVAIPWVNPLAPGPSTSIGPWLVCAACTALLCWTLPALRVPTPMLAAAAVLLLAMLARPGGLSPESVMAGAAVLLVLACAGVAAQVSHDARFGAWLATGWLAAALVSCVIALCQYFSVADRFAPLMTSGAVPEAFANLRQRNQFASLTAIGMIALLWFVGRGLRLRYALAAALLLAIGNAAAASRTGALQLVMIAVSTWVWSGPAARRQGITCAVALIAFVAAALTLPALQDLLVGAQVHNLVDRLASDIGCSSRRVLWSNVLDLVALKPLWGWGWGNLDYAHFTHLYAGARFCDILDNAHNLPLHLAVELGIPVALLLCAGLAWLVVRGKPWRETDATRQMAWGVLAALLLHSMVEYPLWYGPFEMALGLGLGLVWPRASRILELPPRAGLAMAAAFSALTVFAAWDYHRVSQIYLAPEARSKAYRDNTMDKIRSTWLFGNPARFAELTITPLSRANAAEQYAAASELLHYSPEPQIAQRLIEAALLLGREQEATLALARFKAAFPADHALWLQERAAPASAATP